VLINIDPLLTPDWLYVLAAMGHGDELAVVDANFPAESVARGTAYGRPLHLSGATMPEALSAVLSLLPLDEHVEAPVRPMAAAGEDVPDVQRQVQAVADRGAGRHWRVQPIERFSFYDVARACYAVVLSGELRYFGNVIIKKGAVPPSSAVARTTVTTATQEVSAPSPSASPHKCDEDSNYWPEPVQV
jgi:L-fucose mutarotase